MSDWDVRESESEVESAHSNEIEVCDGASYVVEDIISVSVYDSGKSSEGQSDQHEGSEYEHSDKSGTMVESPCAAEYHLEGGPVVDPWEDDSKDDKKE